MREHTHDETPSSAPVAPAVPLDYGPEGVDRTLIRWMLSLTPTQRLEALQAAADSLRGLRLARKTGD